MASKLFQCILLVALNIHAAYADFSLRDLPPNTTDDEQALLSFKVLIIGDPQGVLSSWTIHGGTNTSRGGLCSWRGVACRSRRHPQRVTSLELVSCNLTGAISPYLANLTFLHKIDLSYNLLSARIPPELGFLSRLWYLNLQHNSLQGEIPLSLTHYSKLRVLNLEYNSLTGEILANFSHCRDLQVLYLGTNQLSGDIPSSFGGLSKLTKFGVHSNNLVGGIPSSLGNLSSLKYLYLGMNNLQGHIPHSLGRMKNLLYLGLAFAGLSGTVPRDIFNISSLIAFQMAGNNLSGTLPSDTGTNLPNLQFLLMYDCQFRGQIPQTLANASQLRWIQLENNEFEGIVPSNIGSLTSLQQLTLNSNKLEAKWDEDWELLKSLANCTRLQILELTSNNFQGVFPPSLVNLSTTIQSILLSNNKISGAISPDIRKLEKLSRFNLHGNLLTGIIPSTIGELQNLQGLDLSNNNINGKIPPSVGNLTRLSLLNLSANKLQGPIPASIGSLGNIASFDLSHNQLDGAIPKQLGNLHSLTQKLSLSSNLLTGPIPSEVGKLANLFLLDLSNNKLSGEIPTTLSESIELAKLYMQDNLLQGVIPMSLSDLKGIEVLDIAGNNLSGFVPEFFDTLPYMEYLNLSYNNLEGPIPVKETGILSNASRFFIIGNRVCGGIRELELPPCPIQVSDAKKHRLRKVMAMFIAAGTLSLLMILICWLYFCLRRQQQHEGTALPALDVLDLHWQVSFVELQRATNSFSPDNFIGSGSFGSVYRGTLGQDMQEVAIKVLDLLQHGAERSFLAECHALRSIRHRNLVKVITACSSTDHQGNDFKALVYEFMPHGDLDSWVHGSLAIENGGPKKLSVTQRVNIALDVAKALDYLHHQGEVPIVHCDLKPSNVLLDDNMVAHVGDFGLSRFVHTTKAKATNEASTSAGIPGSIGYIAPEYGAGRGVSVEGDVYSYGILLLEMFTRKRPTDSFFQGTCTLRSYVAACYPKGVAEIIDPILFQLKQGANREFGGEVDMEKLQHYMVPIFQVGLQCTEESSSARMNIRDVIRELTMVKDVLAHHF